MAKPKFQAVKGTRDILPPDSALWNRVEQTAREVFATYNFGEIRLPIFERASLFEKSVGEETDIVSKEMYSWVDSPQISAALGHIRKPFEGQRLEEGESREEFKKMILERIDAGLLDVIGKRVRSALRPEATASVCRAYLQDSLYSRTEDTKLFYIGPMFRRERPQKGRYRQFYQIGAEVLGQSDHPAIDAEVIEMVMVFIARCGLEGCKLAVNSIGCPDCRPAYVAKLQDELRKVEDRLGPDSRRRIETNPLRVLDSKVKGEQEVIAALPTIADHLCDECKSKFAGLQQELKAREIEFTVNPRLVRGLDYYRRTTFEITAPGLGSQDAVCGGGRYDGLVEMLGGPPTKGIGFSLGTDRLMLALQGTGKLRPPTSLTAYVVWMGTADNAGRNAARAITRKLRDAGVSVEMLQAERKLSKAMDAAAKSGARFAIIIGEDEVSQQKFMLRDLNTSKQDLLSESDLLSRVSAT